MPTIRWRLIRDREDVQFTPAEIEEVIATLQAGKKVGIIRRPDSGKRETTRSVLLEAPDAAEELRRADRGGPWCDTCQRPSVAGSILGGLAHASEEHPFGIPPNVEEFDHVPNHSQWFNTPT